MRRDVPLLAKVLGIAGFGILYIPVMMMIIYSFNSSKLVAVWAGFSTKWYKELWTDDILLAALYKSLLIGLSSATISTVFGLLIAIAFVRFSVFKGRLILSLVASAPLVMPEAVTGLSMLLLFIAMEISFGWPSGLRGLRRDAVSCWRLLFLSLQWLAGGRLWLDCRPSLRDWNGLISKRSRFGPGPCLWCRKTLVCSVFLYHHLYLLLHLHLV